MFVDRMLHDDELDLQWLYLSGAARSLLDGALHYPSSPHPPPVYPVLLFPSDLVYVLPSCEITITVLGCSFSSADLFSISECPESRLARPLLTGRTTISAGTRSMALSTTCTHSNESNG